jgi:hypothetical protein
MKCPHCGMQYKDKGRAKGGKKSRRIITPEQQKVMQEMRARKMKLRKELFPDEDLP